MIIILSYFQKQKSYYSRQLLPAAAAGVVFLVCLVGLDRGCYGFFPFFELVGEYADIMRELQVMASVYY